MGSSALTWSGQAIGKEFIDKLLYVQHVDKKKDKTSELSERTLRDLLADDRKVCEDSTNSTENGGNPDESNLDILKSFLKDRIIVVRVCSNPLPISRGSSSRVAFHAFVLFATGNTANSKKEMYWSLEKNGKYIVLQQSENEDNVAKKLYDPEKGQSVERYGEVKFKKWNMGNFRPLEDLLQVIWETNQISDPYHLLYSNCQHFASFIFEKSNGQNEKWSTWVSSIFGRLSRRKKKTGIEVNAVMYQSIFNDDKFDYCNAMMDGRRKDFEELINNLPDESRVETLNSVDSQGYTLLEWATVFSTSHWPIAELLKDKGAQILSDEGSFRRNLFFIALQYLPTNQELSSSDGIDIHGVNQTGDTALHLALYGEKWKLADEILNQFEDYEVNSTNSLGDTPLHLAAKLKCEIDLFKKILNGTNSGNVNKVDGNGWTALHYAIDNKFKTKVEELLNHKDVDVNIQNREDNSTALHLASKWPNIPADLFQMILEKSTSDTINTEDVHGSTVLLYAIYHKSKTAVKELLNHKDVIVNVANNQNNIALHIACFFENFPMDLFKLILEKTTDINAQNKNGNTALHFAILTKSENKVKELLKHEKVDVIVANNRNVIALHLASSWPNIPMELFKIILKRSTNINAQDEDGDTALHLAIDKKSKTKVKELLEDNRVDVNVKNNDHETALHWASMWEDIPVDLFKLILEISDDINAQGKDENTALHYAILHQSKSKVKKLLEDDRVNVNFKTNQNLTALHLASSWPNTPMDLFKIILEKTIDINAQDIDGETALHYAIWDQSGTKVKKLLEDNHVDVNVKNKTNNTAIHLASHLKDIPMDLFKIILEKSDDINAQDNNGWTALHYAISGKSEITTKALLARSDVKVGIKNKDHETAVTPLHLASCWKDIPFDLFKTIQNKSTDINAQDEDGDTALHVAFYKKSKEAVTALLEDDRVDVNVKNNENHTPLHFASLWKDIPTDLYEKIVQKSLLETVNAQDKDGNIALPIAISRKSEDGLKHKNRSFDVKNNYNQTVFYHASDCWKDPPVFLDFTLEILNAIMKNK